MTFSVTANQKNTMLNTITSSIGSGATVVIYAGLVPANADAALGGATVLATLPCSATFAAAASGGTLTANSITQENATGTGTATFYRILTSGSTVIAQGAAGTTGFDMNLNTTAIVTGGPCIINSFTVSM